MSTSYHSKPTRSNPQSNKSYAISALNKASYSFGNGAGLPGKCRLYSSDGEPSHLHGVADNSSSVNSSPLPPSNKSFQLLPLACQTKRQAHRRQLNPTPDAILTDFAPSRTINRRSNVCKCLALVLLLACLHRLDDCSAQTTTESDSLGDISNLATTQLDSSHDRHIPITVITESSQDLPTTDPSKNQVSGSLDDFYTKFRQNLKLKTTTPIPTDQTTLATNQSPATTLIEPTAALTSETETVEIEGDQNDSSTRSNAHDAPDCKGLSNYDPTEAKNYTDNERLVNLQSCIQGRVKSLISGYARGSLELFEKLSLSGGCSSSVLTLTGSLMETRSFAFKFIDASAKIPSGFLYGLLSDFGDYDQCLSIRSRPGVEPEVEVEEGAFSGKYCLFNIRPDFHAKLAPNNSVPDGIMADGILWDDLIRNYWMSNSTKGFQVALCLPSRCDDDDISQVYRLFTDSYNLKGELMSCQSSLDLKEQHRPDLVQEFIMIVFLIVAVLNLLGTMVHRYVPDAEMRASMTCNNLFAHYEGWCSCRANRMDILIKTLMCFSVIRNWRRFLSYYPKDVILRDESFSRASINTDSIVTSHSDYSIAETNATSTRICLAQNGSDSATNIKPPAATCTPSGGKAQQMVVRISPGVAFPKLARPYSLSHLSGLHLFVIGWITIGYSFLYPSANNYQHYRSIIKMNIARDSIWFAIINFTLGIDMLLYMTGFLFVLELIPVQQVGRKSVPRFLLNHRGIMQLVTEKLLRFWPTYLTVIALAILAPLASDGPMWPEMVSKKIGAACRNNWWSNLLFVNNFLKESEVCLPSSWFISVIMQLFLLGAIIVVIVRKISMSLGIISIVLMLVGSSGLSFMHAYYARLTAPVIRLDETFIMEMDENIFRLYTTVFNNCGPFLVGMLGGLILIKCQRHHQTDSRSTRRQEQQEHKKEKTPIYKRFRLISLFKHLTTALIVKIISLAVLSSVFFVGYTPFWAAIYWSLHRIGWAIVTGYIIHMCSTGSWRLLHDLLSLSTFTPLSKLIFIAYLLYPIFIYIHSGLVRDGLHVTIFNMLSIYITRLVFTFATALAVHLFVESPFCSIEEMYLNMWLRKVTPPSKPDETRTKHHPLLSVAPIVSLQVDDPKSDHSALFELGSLNKDVAASDI